MSETADDPDRRPNKTTISIALTTFNGERFLREQLESLARQTRLPDELVVVDDGSHDESLEILNQFAAQAPFRVRLHRNDSQLGWRGNFFKAASLCKGSLIAFCDQDDIWYPEKLAVVEPRFASPDILLVHHDADLIDDRGTVYGTLRDGENDKEDLKRLSKPTIWSHAPGLTIVFRQSLLGFVPYWPDSIDPGSPNMPAAHDQWVYHLASNLGSIRYIPRSLVGYRQHSANQVGFQSKRHHAFSSPKALRNEISIHSRMIASFRNALQEALSDQRTGFEAELPEAIVLNRALEGRLTLRSTLYEERSLLRRLGTFRKLLQTRSYSRTTKWNLGRRSLLADIRAVIQYPG